MRPSTVFPLSLFLLIFLWPLEFSPNHPPTFILWNVGQGQWATLSESHRCWHFDMGGEQAPWVAIFKECRKKEQWLSLSHWDWDHLSFVRRARMHWPRLCRKHAPLGSSTPSRERLILNLPTCPQGSANPTSVEVLEVDWWSEISHGIENLKANDLSRVFVIRSALGSILLTGDATARMERLWAHKLKDMNISYLVLGHHGSRTSTSVELLQQLPQLRLSLVSARRARYNHPHPLVTERLSQRHIPWVGTEDFGHIRILLVQKGDTPAPNHERPAHSRQPHYRH